MVDLKSHSQRHQRYDDKLRIYYYRGSDHDVVDVDILETVKTGDRLTINKYPDIGLDDVFQQEPRTVTGITTSDTVTTNTYIDAGITTVRTLQRPVTWKKQIQDVVVNNIGIGKDRVELEPNIRPTAYLIKSVSKLDQLRCLWTQQCHCSIRLMTLVKLNKVF